MSGKVQNANTHNLRRQNHELRAQQSVSSRATVQWGAGCKFKECSKCKRPLRNPAHKQGTAVNSAGRWMKGQGQFKRQTHCVSPIIVHIGVNQRCCADDVESPATLPTMSTHVTFQRGDGGNSQKVQNASTHLLRPPNS
eukprot:scaffold26994_cov83-Phaeocystis_antarctica.AAC.4